MSLASCGKCDGTPCTCGYEYERWQTAEIQELHGVLGRLLARRAAGEPVRVEPATAYSIQEMMTVYEFSGSAVFETKRIQDANAAMMRSLLQDEDK